MVIGVSDNRMVKVVQTESSIDVNNMAKIIASVITDGDSNAYINNIIQKRKNKLVAGRCKNA